MNKGDSISYSFTGGVQTFTIPNSGIYMLEAWGSVGKLGACQGATGSPGNGGYAKGYIRLKKGTVLYIVCGGNNGSHTSQSYNGGGASCYGNNNGRHYSSGVGGGATHIALIDGAITSMTKAQFDTSGLIIAGGGAGGGAWRSNDEEAYYRNGGSGGASDAGGGSFGAGVNSSGWFTDTSGKVDNAGGGGYVGGTYNKGGTSNVSKLTAFKGDNPSTTGGANSTTGKAKITLVQKSSAYYGTKDCDVYLGDQEVEFITLGDTMLS